MDCNICTEIAHRKVKAKQKLTELILDCWQREYDSRPYFHFIFHEQVFKNKFYRPMNNNDFLIILSFLEKRPINNLELLHCSIPSIHTKQFLSCLSHLVNVNLSHSDVPMELYKYLADEAENLTLKTLKLCGTIIDKKQSEYLRSYLTKTDKLFFLDIKHCNISHTTLAIIADGILHCPNLKCIDISDIVPDHPQQRSDSTKISIILSILFWSSPLLEVHFQKTGIDDFGMELIAENIPRSSLRVLDIGVNNIGPRGTDVLFKALPYSNVVAVIMPSNNIGDSGASIIAGNLNYTKLQHLDIRSNGISAESMEQILKSLMNCNPLKTLNISGNKFNFAVGFLLNKLLNDQILNSSGLDVTTVFSKEVEAYRIFPIENQLLSHYQGLKKLSRYCLENKINPDTMMWLKKNSRHVFGLEQYRNFACLHLYEDCDNGK